MAPNKDYYTITQPIVPLLENPSSKSEQCLIAKNNSQILFGESLNILSSDMTREENKKNAPSEWQLVEVLHNTPSSKTSYKGFIKKEYLTPQKHAPTHFVNVISAHIYPEPQYKTYPILSLSFTSQLKIINIKDKNGFIETECGWIFKEHITELSKRSLKSNLADTALQFLGCPYLYGGRSHQGIDCSALVQLSAFKAGLDCPRDSNQQIEFAKTIQQKDLQKGDLIFFPSHVAIALDQEKAINASSRHMSVKIENISELENIYKGITGYRRL